MTPAEILADTLAALAPPTPMRLVLNADGTVAAIGRAAFVPGDGQRVLDVPDGAYAAFVAADAAVPGDTARIHYDEQTGEFRGEGHR
jgi:hypothetical protein